MSVLKKLMDARIELQGRKLNKSGHNKFAGYDYFELGDFLPVAQEIFAKLGLCGIVSYDKEIAKLTITDVENGTAVEITSPMGSAALKGCHEVQNIGAVETYQRRYLWVTALEIVEHDALEATTGNDKSKVVPTKTGWEPNKEQLEYLKKELLTIVGHLSNGAGASAADHFYRPNGLDQEEQLWIWNQLTPSDRRLIKALKEG